MLKTNGNFSDISNGNNNIHNITITIHSAGYKIVLFNKLGYLLILIVKWTSSISNWFGLIVAYAVTNSNDDAVSKK